MALPLALPLAPVVSAGATAAAATFVAGSTAALAKSVYGFRRQAPTLPPITGTEGLASLQELLADAWAGAQVPVGVPVPPPFNPGGLGLAAAAAAGLWKLGANLINQLWGLLNGPARYPQGIQPADDRLLPSGSYRRGIQTPDGRYTAQGAHRFGIRNQNGSWVISPWSAYTSENSNSLIPSSMRWGGVYADSGDPDFLWASFHTWEEYIDGQYVQQASPPENFVASAFAPGFNTLEIIPIGDVDPTQLETLQGPSVEERPWVTPATFADLEAAAITPLLVAPLLPAPLTLQPVPEATPVEQPAGAGGAGLQLRSLVNPAVGFEFQRWSSPDQPTPAQWIWPRALSPEPALRPGTIPGTNAVPASPVELPKLPTVFPSPSTTQPTTQTQPDGSLVPSRPPATTTTDPGSIVPWPGASPIPGTGPSPRPNLEGIAQEVGKIERKIELMMTPQAPGNLVDRFGNLSDLISPLIEAIISLNSGTTYSLDSPCEVDAEGNMLPPVVVEAPGALTSFGAMLNRMDALAELLQVHKNLKQPNCKPKQPTGEFVTVNFEQID